MANPYDQFDASSNPYDQFDAAPEPSMGSQVKRQLGLTARAGVEAVAALPLAAADFGMGVRDLITGERHQPASAMFNQGMNQIFPQRQTALEKGVGLVGSAIAGAGIPTPGISGAAPVGFKTANELTKEGTAAAVKAAQNAGFVVPPATSNPTSVTRTLEGVAGKLSTGQQASAINSGNTARVIAQDLGLSESTPLTAGAVRAVREEAGKAYETVRNAGTVKMDDRLLSAINRAQSQVAGAGKSFPSLADNSAVQRIEGLKQEQFDAGDAVDAISILRDYAQQAGKAGSKHLAGVYRRLATEFENALDRHLVAAGDAKAVSAFREARKIIAQTYTAEKALNPATGQASALKLAQELSKGKPISGGMREAAQFGQAFPKAARLMNESLPGVSPLDVYAAGGIAGVSGKSSFLAMPFIRQGVRNLLFSPLGQRLAVPSNRGPVDPRVVNALAIEAGLVGQQ